MSVSASTGASPSGLRRTFQSLSIRNYRILWYGTLFSFIGMQMQMIARGYLAYDLTHSNTALGGVMIAFGVPQLLLTLWGGVVADRMDKRNVLIIWQAAIAVASALMAIAIATDHVAYWMLIASGVVTGAAFSFIGPARQAFIGDLVPDQLMGNAIVLQQANMNGTRVFGPALAGAMIATPLIGMAGVYAFTTVGFIITVATMFLLPPGRPRRATDGRSAMQQTVDGLRYVRQDRPVAILLLASFGVVALAFPYQGFLASITESEFRGGAVALGVLSSVAAVGALAATLVVASLTAHRHAWRIQALAGVGFGMALVAFAFAPTFLVGLVTILLVGAFASAFQSLNNALAMVLTERVYYGRVQALLGIGWSLFGIVSLPLGIVADLIGIRQTLALMGIAGVVVVVALELLARAWGVDTILRERRTRAAADSFAPARRRLPSGEPASVPASPASRARTLSG